MPTLAERRARKNAPKVPHADVPVTMIEGQHLFNELQLLVQERDSIQAEKERLERQAKGVDDDGNATRAPLKGGEKVETGQRVAEIDTRLAEIEVRSKAIREELSAEHQPVVGLRGWENFEWQEWKDAHPPREGNEDDQDYALGKCNYSDLLAALGTFAVTLDGEDLADGDWDGWLRGQIILAFLRDMVMTVVIMHESHVPLVPKSSSPSPVTVADGTA